MKKTVSNVHGAVPVCRYDSWLWAAATRKLPRRKKVLKVGTEPTFAPFEFQKEGSKEFDGFDMDLIRAHRQKDECQGRNSEHGF
jgi:ABC-type amino acid transport substrate-binding protein